MKLETRIMLAATGAVALATALSIGIVYHLSSKNRVAELRGKMSSIISQSELVAKNMDAMYMAKSFDTTGLLASAKAKAGGRPLREVYAQTALYHTIPIVAAWESVEGPAAKNGFKFFTPIHPGLNARNPKNVSTPEFADAFAAFDKGEDEYFRLDPAKDELVLARPVHLLPSCISCHGDPAKSATGDGKDVLGFTMENMKVDDHIGAFVLKANIGNDPVVMATMQFMAIGGFIVLLLVLVGFYFFNQRAIIRPLQSAIQTIGEVSRQTAQSAGEITSTSHSLAEGASEQAAAIEETSAALEELASMTKRNSDSSQKANTIAKQARDAADKGTDNMKEMDSAMVAIKASSDDIAKILKTIDEIAFQTNILALNAAVEAARAGEAGLGFAVVADEVRALAQRCAQAAKETAAKIDDAITKTGQGVEISGKVAAALGDIQAKARQVDDLAAEVASASREQTQGITQINTTVGEMDKVTQNNAAAAEESAAAAGELNSQANTMRDSVALLLELVNGTAVGQPASAAAPETAAPSRTTVRPILKPKTKFTHSANGVHKNGNGSHASLPAAPRRSDIPMDGDFKDF